MSRAAGNTGEQILYVLKTQGPHTAQQLADLLGFTSMGARRQLEAAQEKGYVAFDEVADKVGRPARRWLLTGAGHARFPDRHGELTVQLIEQVRTLFGEAGLDKLIAGREHSNESQYQDRLDGCADLPARVAALAHLREAEGYMAQVETRADGSLLLIENHCPICAAASACQNFCRSELMLFQRVLGDCLVERDEHLLSGGRRCVYVIKPLPL